MIEISLSLHRVVYALDRAGDRRLRDRLGISHGRAALLLTIDRNGPCDQHEIAQALGHTDPAITAMVRELAGQRLVNVQPDPYNRRRRVVSLTAAGAKLVTTAVNLLDDGMAELLTAAGVDSVALSRELDKLNMLLAKSADY